jgi:hypothetical protein
MNHIRFEEKQSFHWLAYTAVIVALVVISVPAALAFMQPGETEKLGSAWWIPLIIALGLVAGLNVFQMCTTVTDTQLIVQFGYLFPMYRKRIKLDKIKSSRAVLYRPIRDAGGWGIRFGRFEGKACRFLNSRGDRGVLLETETHRYIIGSQDPEQLKIALEAAGDFPDTL